MRLSSPPRQESRRSSANAFIVPTRTICETELIGLHLIYLSFQECANVCLPNKGADLHGGHRCVDEPHCRAVAIEIYCTVKVGIPPETQNLTCHTILLRRELQTFFLINRRSNFSFDS